MQDARNFADNFTADEIANQDYITTISQLIPDGDFSDEEIAELHLLKAIIYTRLNDETNAQQSYNTALNINGISPILKATAFKNRGLLSYTQQKYASAVNDFEQALAILSGNSELHYYLANSYLGILDYQKALFAYDQALEGMASNRFLAYFGKATVYYQQNLFEPAKQELLKSLNINPSFEPTINLLAKINNNDQNQRGVLKQNSNIQADGKPAKQLTANEIFNQLLEKAAKARSEDGDAAQTSFKITLSPDKTDLSIESQTTTNVEKLSTGEVNSKKTNQQVSDTPFIIEATNNKLRLDNLLQPKYTGYFLQLSNNIDRKSAEIYYANMLKKHQLLLGNKSPVIREINTQNDAINYQLLIGDFQSFKQAESLCKLIKAQKSDCFIRQLK